MPAPLPLPPRPRPVTRRSVPRSAALLLAVLLTACGGRALGPTADLERVARDPAATPTADDDDRAPDAVAVVPPGDLPGLRSETTAPTRPRIDRDAPAPAPLGAVDPVRPRVRIDGVAGDVLPRVLGVEGVRFATVVALSRVALGAGSLQVAAVDPRGFREVTPPVTAASAAVWDRLAAGDAVLDHPAGRRLGVRPGEDLSTASGQTITVGAVASHAEPALADAVLPHVTADALGLEGSQTVLVALADGADVAQVAQRLTALDVGAVSAVDDAAAHTAWLVGDDPATLAAFEPFRYTDGDGGVIRVDPGWVQEHIVTAEVPVLGRITCHRKLMAPLRAALQRVVDEGLADRVDPDDQGGCFAPRHIDRNTDANLSMHAWGLAVDVNVSSNPLGAAPQQDPGVVAAFEEAGFTWGGRWRRPDGMHFELGRLDPDHAA